MSTTHNFHIILTVEQYNKLAERAKQSGESMSTLIRQYIEAGLRKKP